MAKKFGAGENCPAAAPKKARNASLVDLLASPQVKIYKKKGKGLDYESN